MRTGVGFIAGLAENLAINDDNRVGAQNQLAGLLTRDAAVPFLAPGVPRSRAGSLRLRQLQECWLGTR